jgi:hypothetical protein
MTIRYSLLIATALLTTLALSPSVFAVGGKGQVSTGCTPETATADATGNNPSVVAKMFGGTDHDYYYNDETLAHEDVSGTGGGTATADSAAGHAHCSTGGDSGCPGLPGVTAMDSPDVASISKSVSYRGFIGYVPATSTYLFYGTVNRDGIVLPYATTLDGTGTLVLTRASIPIGAPTGLGVITCLPVDVDLGLP